MRLVAVSLALTSLLMPQAQKRIQIETYLIPVKMQSRWITIEYDNPNCPPLNENDSGREVAIPGSGFLCTSSPRYMGWHRTKYYFVDESKRRTALRAPEFIHRREGFILKYLSSVPGDPACDVTGEEFFYGPKEKLTYENPIAKDKDFLKLHPSCRQASRF
jgi:hypothetical protein